MSGLGPIVVTEPKESACICTRSGIRFDLLNPTPDMVLLEDIAFALSNQARYNGHAGLYSVAEHSVRCANYAERVDPLDFENQRYALLHDAAEAYVGDIASPLKKLLPRYQAIERKILDVIFEKYGLCSIMPGFIDTIDDDVFRAEFDSLMPKVDWFDPGEPRRKWAISSFGLPLSPSASRDLFLLWCKNLGVSDS